MKIIKIGIVVCSLFIFNKPVYECELNKNIIKRTYVDEYNVLYNNIDNYMKKIAPTHNINIDTLISKTIQYDINIGIVIAQGQVESLFGTCGLARKTNSVWNVGMYDNHKYSMIHSKFKFSTPTQSIEPYLKLLATEYNGGSLKNFVNHRGERYASDPNYEIKLKSVINNMEKYNIISQYNAYKELVKK